MGLLVAGFGFLRRLHRDNVERLDEIDRCLHRQIGTDSRSIASRLDILETEFRALSGRVEELHSWWRNHLERRTGA